MPYIDKDRRESVELLHDAENAGELNYVVSKIVSDYLARKGLKYANINEAIGVLECAKLELYRRIAAPYEDRKIAENGDVYPASIRP